MSIVYITGHRNPDLDSICSAYAYGVLKNKIDSENEYIPVRCGHLNDNVKGQLEVAGLEAVPYLQNVYPKVIDVMNTSDFIMDASEPAYSLIKKYDSERPSAMPIFDGDDYCGLLSIDDITNWFLKDNSDEFPLYDIEIKNIEKVLPGKIIKRGQDIKGGALIAGAASIEKFSQFVDSNKNCIVVTGHIEEHIQYAMNAQVPAIVITVTDDLPGIDYSSYNGTLYVTTLGTAETLRRLRMAVSLKKIMSKQGQKLQADCLFDDAKSILMDSKMRGLSVFDGDKWIGFVTRRCFLNKPSYKVILVDHNEVGQSIKGIESATVLEIIDHHRLDALKTDLPVFIDAEPIGSTCSIVYQQFIRNSVIPDKKTAKTLLTGILADTLVLKSPTTTDTDKSSAGALAALCGIFDIQKYGETLFTWSKTLAQVNPEDVIPSDFKIYSKNGKKIGIGQCETNTLLNVSSYADKYIKALEKIRTANMLDWALLLITDVLIGNSILLVTESKYNAKLPYSLLNDGVYDLPGVMSRKKQLLPEILYCLN